jgi:hypothetical protein
VEGKLISVGCLEGQVSQRCFFDTMFAENHRCAENPDQESKQRVRILTLPLRRWYSNAPMETISRGC